MVRLWEEPREAAGAPPRLRGWVRNLATGERRGLADARQLLEILGGGASLAELDRQEPAPAPGRRSGA